MNIERFRQAFWLHFNGSQRNVPDGTLWDPEVARRRDLCPDVEGMLSLRKQQLLNLAFRLMPAGEAYLEVGTYQGKSLLSAMIGNPGRPVYAVDNFSEFDVNAEEITLSNLERYGVRHRTRFFNADFRSVLTRENIPEPVGFYFYDGAHDEQSQYDAIRLIEPLLADEALILVDDWRHAFDSRSYAEAGTKRAMNDSEHCWKLMYELPARANGDRALWWNGVGVLSFNRAN